MYIYELDVLTFMTSNNKLINRLRIFFSKGWKNFLTNFTILGQRICDEHISKL